MSITLFDETGTPVEYRLLAERYPAFLEKYPIEEGYSIITAVKQYFDFNEKLYELLKMMMELDNEKAIAIFNEYRDVYVVTAVLSKDDKTLLQRTAKGVCRDAKLLESLETAAVQRIVAAAGFDGASIKEDELLAIKQSGMKLEDKTGTAGSKETGATVTELKTQQQGKGQSLELTAPGETDAPEATSEEEEQAEPEKAQPATEASGEAKTEEADQQSSEEAVTDTAPQSKEFDDAGLKSILRQIQNQASLRDYQLPDTLPTDYDSAKQLLKKILTSHMTGKRRAQA